MFGFFKGKKNDKKGPTAKQTNKTPASNSKQRSPESIALRERVKKQIAAKREELGPEAIEKMQKFVKIEAAKNELKSAIDGDRKQELIDEIRYMMDDDKLK